MSQNDFDIANQGFAAFRADLNNALKALASLSSGDTEPTTTYANQLWYETDTNILHIRNEANSAWLDLMVINGATGSPSFNSGDVAFDTNTLFVDATNGRVGVGTASPTTALDVTGTIKGDTLIVGGQKLLMPTNSPLVTLSGSSVDFTGIPETARRVTVMLNGASTNGTSVPLIQLGDAGGIETSGYLGGSAAVATGATSVAAHTAGAGLSSSAAATIVYRGSVSIGLMDATTNLWAISGTLGRSEGGSVNILGYTKSLSATLTQIRLTTNSTDTFDAGTASISWE